MRSLYKLRFAALRFAAPVVAIGVGVALTAAEKPVHAEGDTIERNERCATRLSIALLGRSPTEDLLATANPQTKVDALLGNNAFAERFARFVNSKMNEEPGETVADDASYTLAKYVIDNKKPWKELFVGKYDVTDTVTDDPNGLGYFRSEAWMRRYAGNEADGYRIVAAYRMLQNTTGLTLTATTNAPEVDISAKGREASACAGCHYRNWFALDKVARVLSRRAGTADAITFTPPTDGPQEVLDGLTVANDAELVAGLVASENFRVNACRLAFKFLYGREENTCEARVFEACMDAFAQDGLIQSAVAVVAKDPGFCQ